MKPSLQIFAPRAESDPHEIVISGPIGKSWWSDEGVSGKEIADAIAKVPKGRKILIGVNSQGGAVGEGLEIYNAIARRAADVTVRIDGYALSIASFFPLAAGRVISPKSSIWMIHKAWNYSEGSADAHRQAAEMLDTHDEVIASAYVKRTGKTRDEIIAAMSDETWLSGEEAVAWGLADEISPEPLAKGALDGVDLTPYRKAPKDLSQFLAVAGARAGKPTATPPPANSGADKTTTPHMDPENTQVASNATDPQNIAPATPPAPATKPEPKNQIDPTKFVSVEQFQRIENQLKAEREQRITARLDSIVAQNPDISREEWLPRVLTDEAILNSLAALKPSIPEPVAMGRIENFGNPLIENYNKLSPAMAHVKSAANQNHFVPVPSMNLEKANARIKMRKELGGELIRAFDRHMPRNSNTISSTIKPDALVDQLVVVANNRLAPLSAFSRLFTVDAMRPGASLAVPKATAGSTGQSNPTSWESGDSTLDVISVTLAHKTQSFNISQADANYGFGLDHLAQVNANAFANLLSDVYTAIMTTANYGTAINIGAAAAFDGDGLKPVLAAAKNYTNKNLILDGGHLAYLLPTDKQQFALGESGAYGFDLIAAQNRWTAAATNAVGFVCGPDALAIGAGAPANVSNSQFETYGTFQIAEIGLTVLYTVWFNTATRVRWASYEVMFGAAAGDTTQAEVLTSA